MLLIYYLINWCLVMLDHGQIWTLKLSITRSLTICFTVVRDVFFSVRHVTLLNNNINRTVSICASYLCLIFRTKRAVIRELWCAWNIGEGLGMFMGSVTALPRGARDSGVAVAVVVLPPNTTEPPIATRKP